MKIKKLVQGVILGFSLLFLVILSSCGEDEKPSGDEFNRTELLTSLADGLIIPNFQTAQASVTSLSTAIDAFAENTTEANLQAARAAWEIAVTDYQHCSAFGFGPGELTLGSFATVLGVFPVDEVQVETNIPDANFNLSGTFDRDVRGFFAVEYLLFGNGASDTELIAAFDQARVEYLQLIAGELKSSFDTFVSEWNTYRAQFIANDGTSVGSSVSQLYNEFVKDYENLKNFKVELPAGLTAGQTGPDPTQVEAYYSGISVTLLAAQFESAKNIWDGRSRSGQDLIGFEEYLAEVVGGPELITQTKETIESIDAAIVALPDGPLSENLEATEVAALRDLLQANTANFKSSMSSLLGISITFNSGDGD